MPVSYYQAGFLKQFINLHRNTSIVWNKKKTNISFANRNRLDEMNFKPDFKMQCIHFDDSKQA